MFGEKNKKLYERASLLSEIGDTFITQRDSENKLKYHIHCKKCGNTILPYLSMFGKVSYADSINGICKSCLHKEYEKISKKEKK